MVFFDLGPSDPLSSDINEDAPLGSDLHGFIVLELKTVEALASPLAKAAQIWGSELAVEGVIPIDNFLPEGLPRPLKLGTSAFRALFIGALHWMQQQEHLTRNGNGRHECRERGQVYSKANQTCRAEPLDKVVTCSADDSALVFDVTNGECLQRLTGHASAVYQAVFSPDDSKAVRIMDEVIFDAKYSYRYSLPLPTPLQDSLKLAQATVKPRDHVDLTLLWSYLLAVLGFESLWRWRFASLYHRMADFASRHNIDITLSTSNEPERNVTAYVELHLLSHVETVELLGRLYREFRSFLKYFAEHRLAVWLHQQPTFFTADELDRRFAAAPSKRCSRPETIERSGQARLIAAVWFVLRARGGFRMAAQALRRGSNTPLRRLAFARPGALRYLSLSPWSLSRRRSFSSTPGRTTLGAYLERCGANWGDAYDVEPIQEASGRFTWRAEMPPERLAGLRAGDMLESPTFQLQGGCRGRFQLFPLGDSDSLVAGRHGILGKNHVAKGASLATDFTLPAEGLCSLFLCADAPVLENFQLRLGRVTRDSGASEFCRLEEALQDGFMEVSLELEQRPDVPFEPPE
ncbi:unnamed protein product, partial [Cladocopium goreaui]